MEKEATSPKIPTVQLNHGGVSMPVLGLGMAPNPAVPNEVTKTAVLEAVEVGYRHFDTATIYFTEVALGAGISEVLNSGMVSSREELFITSKLWCSDGHAELVLHFCFPVQESEVGLLGLVPHSLACKWEASSTSLSY